MYHGDVPRSVAHVPRSVAHILKGEFQIKDRNWKYREMYPDPGYTGYIVLKAGYNRGTRGVQIFFFIRISDFIAFLTRVKNELSVYKE